MRAIYGLVAATFVAFVAVIGYFWVETGSLEEAGARVDSGFEKVDRTTEPLQRGVEELGEGAIEALDRATDGDDAT